MLNRGSEYNGALGDLGSFVGCFCLSVFLEDRERDLHFKQLVFKPVKLPFQVVLLWIVSNGE